MKNSTTAPAAKRLTFGDLIVNVYDHCGKARARTLVKHAVNSQCVKFSGMCRLVID